MVQHRRAGGEGVILETRRTLSAVRVTAGERVYWHRAYIHQIGIKLCLGPGNHSDSSVTGFRFQYCKSGLPLV